MLKVYASIWNQIFDDLCFIVINDDPEADLEKFREIMNTECIIHINSYKELEDINLNEYINIGELSYIYN